MMLCAGALTGIGSGLPLVENATGNAKDDAGAIVAVPLIIESQIETRLAHYALRVDAVPAVPLDLQQKPAAKAEPEPEKLRATGKKKSKKRVQTCPVEVRAIVEAEAVEDSFAMLFVNGEARLVHLKQAIDTPSGNFVLEAIQPGGVVLAKYSRGTKGRKSVRCSFRP